MLLNALHLSRCLTITVDQVVTANVSYLHFKQYLTTERDSVIYSSYQAEYVSMTTILWDIFKTNLWPDQLPNSRTSLRCNSMLNRQCDVLNQFGTRKCRRLSSRTEGNRVRTNAR